MIEITGVGKSHGATLVIDNVTLRIPGRAMTSIIGPNGAGKSTLLSMISRLSTMDKGRITVGGLDVTTTPGDMLAKRLSILRQDNAVGSRLTVRDLVAFGRYPYSKGRPSCEDRQHVERAIACLDLEAFGERFLDQLSGGQRQRAFLAMILCQDTDYMLLDEPLNNLDMKHSASIMTLLRRAVDELGKTVVLVLHDINFASCHCDYMVAMRRGKVLYQGTPDRIMRRDVLRDIYETDIAVETIGGKPIAVYSL
ncbi:MAG: ATP-binding cassette domain-containing protein [Hyphomicrobiales bacterium]